MATSSTKSTGGISTLSNSPPPQSLFSSKLDICENGSRPFKLASFSSLMSGNDFLLTHFTKSPAT
ncbi:hypothetical protein OIU77_006450 [Salix suchowensis]|uniref:Uncharacterized protein n=1 Tax=Salix suchowensis TaxID=1278906 RepID=A0ABQ9AKQ8_9ROSI|nr:hypothetical protein OIU77_006450 [Salix suchowensis]